MNARIVMAAAEGIVRATDSTMLSENGGHISITLSWAYSLLKQMNFVKRKATKNQTGDEFKQVKREYLNKIRRSIKDEKIPPELVINWDQTGVKVVPASQWTMAERGAPRVEIVGEGDKRQITITLVVTLSGAFQVLYEGKTER